MLEVLVPIVAVIVVAAIFGGAFALFVFMRRREGRTQSDVAELVSFAQQRGWTYQESQSAAVDRFSGGEPFPTSGQNLPAWDLITGSYRGHPFSCFEYRPRSIDIEDDTENVDYFRIFALVTPAQRPMLQVTRAGFGSKILDAVGVEDVQMGYPEFDKAFRVTTDNEQFARDVLTGDTMHWLLGDQRAHEMPFRFERNELVTWQRARLDAASIDTALNYLCDVLDRVPAVVWR